MSLSKKVTIFDYFNDTSQWKNEYFHPEFNTFLDTDTLRHEKMFEGTFQFPLFSNKFCEELIDVCKNVNIWSTGKNQDKRVKGGYENFPTVDVHLNQIELHNIWNDIVKNYISKVASKLYPGQKTKGTNINFVVKYSMGNQEFLKPHHDFSEYTLNIALNQQGKDFTGGGCHFISQNYSLTHTPIGFCNIHPGRRLTHYHEGIPITSGTRFILVSFVE